MGEIVNLRRARKAMMRDAAAHAAAEQRIRHGRTLAEKHASAAEQERAAKALDGARRE